MTYKQRLIQANKTISKLEKEKMFLKTYVRQLKPKSIFNLVTIINKYFKGDYKRRYYPSFK